MTKSLILAFFCCFFALQAAQAQQIEFETLEINYGDIEKGANGVREFRFKNVGKAPLIIESVQTSCGCLASDYPKEPIMPNQLGRVWLKYDTQRIGYFTKTATLKSNSIENPTIILKVRGEVQEQTVAPKQELIPNGSQKLD